MNIKVHCLLIFLSILFFCLIIFYLRMGSLDLRYTLIWLTVAVLLIVLSIFPQLTISLSNVFGIQEPFNMALLFGVFFLMIILFMQNIIVTKLMQRIVNISQEVSIIRNELREIKESQRVSRLSD